MILSCLQRIFLQKCIYPYANSFLNRISSSHVIKTHLELTLYAVNEAHENDKMNIKIASKKFFPVFAGLWYPANIVCIS